MSGLLSPAVPAVTAVGSDLDDEDDDDDYEGGNNEGGGGRYEQQAVGEGYRGGGLKSSSTRRRRRQGRGSCPSDEMIDEAEATEGAAWTVSRGGAGGTPTRGGAAGRLSSSGRWRRDDGDGVDVDVPRSSSPTLPLQQARGKLQQSGGSGSIGRQQPRLQIPAAPSSSSILFGPSTSAASPAAAAPTTANGRSQTNTPMTTNKKEKKEEDTKEREEGSSLVQSFLESVCDQCNVATTTSQAGETVSDLYHNNIAPSFDALADGIHTMMSYGGSGTDGEDDGNGGER